MTIDLFESKKHIFNYNDPDNDLFQVILPEFNEELIITDNEKKLRYVFDMCYEAFKILNSSLHQYWIHLKC